MDIEVVVPKGLMPDGQLSKLANQFSLRTHVHLSHLGVEWKTPILTTDPFFRAVDSPTTEVLVTIRDPQGVLSANDIGKRLSNLLEMSLSEILDGLEIPFASVAIRINPPSGGATLKKCR